jgi:hypothetical protein
MAKFGWHSGYLKAQNLQGGLKSVTVDSNGDGTASVTFDYAFKTVPQLFGNANEQDITASVSFGTITTTGAIIVVDGAAKTSSTLSVSWLAFDYSA